MDTLVSGLFYVEHTWYAQIIISRVIPYYDCGKPVTATVQAKCKERHQLIALIIAQTVRLEYWLEITYIPQNVESLDFDILKSKNNENNA